MGHLAYAGFIDPMSYSGPNGGSGYFSYRDDTYNGNGDPNADYSPLSNGLGQLSDHQMSPDGWFQAPGGWVGWLQTPADNGGAVCVPGVDPGCHPALGVNPVITFSFPAYFFFDRVHMHFDDANGFGAVRVPLLVRIADEHEERSFLITPPANPGPSMYDFDVTGMGGDELTVTMLFRDQWIMLDEVMIEGTPTPEPATLLFVGAGLACLLGARKAKLL